MNFTHLIPCLTLGIMLSCNSPTPLQPANQTKIEVNHFYDAYANHLSSKGLVGIDTFFSKSNDFYWIEDGQVMYPSYKSLKKQTDTLGLAIKLIQLEEYTRRIDVISPKSAVIFSEFKEDITLMSDYKIVIDGATTFLVNKENGSWKFLIGHTSTKRNRNNP